MTEKIAATREPTDRTHLISLFREIPKKSQGLEPIPRLANKESFYAAKSYPVVQCAAPEDLVRFFRAGIADLNGSTRGEKPGRTILCRP